MNLQFVLEALQNLRTRIDAWGLTTESLWIAAAVAAVFFLLSFREVITWFLKMSHLREELRELREENAAMRTSIDQIHALLAVQESTAEVPAAAAKAVEAPKRFPLDH